VLISRGIQQQLKLILKSAKKPFFFKENIKIMHKLFIIYYYYYYYLLYLLLKKIKYYYYLFIFLKVFFFFFDKKHTEFSSYLPDECEHAFCSTPTAT
jgi:hypothetical protein